MYMYVDFSCELDKISMNSSIYLWIHPSLTNFAPLSPIRFRKWPSALIAMSIPMFVCCLTPRVNVGRKRWSPWFYQRMYSCALPQTFTGCTYGAPGSRSPLVVCWWHIPAVVSRMASRVLRISVRLVVDALAVVDGGAGGCGTLLVWWGSLIRVTESLVDWLVVVWADHLSGCSPDTACDWTLGQRTQPMWVNLT